MIIMTCGHFFFFLTVAIVFALNVIRVYSVAAPGIDVGGDGEGTTSFQTKSPKPFVPRYIRISCLL